MDHTDSQSAISINSTTPSTSTYDTSSEKQLICSAKEDEECPLNEILQSHLDRDASQRSVLLTRSSLDESFGFALQSYVFKRASSPVYERITYVDYVSASSSAGRAGMELGDMVISVNGTCVVTKSHAEIVETIMNCLHVSLTLVFKDVARIVSLTMRSYQLSYLLEEKKRELRRLEDQERLLQVDDETENQSGESSLYELDKELVSPKKHDMEYSHLIRINSSNSIGSTHVTRL